MIDIDIDVYTVKGGRTGDRQRHVDLRGTELLVLTAHARCKSPVQTKAQRVALNDLVLPSKQTDEPPPPDPPGPPSHIQRTTRHLSMTYHFIRLKVVELGRVIGL